MAEGQPNGGGYTPLPNRQPIRIASRKNLTMGRSLHQLEIIRYTISLWPACQWEEHVEHDYVGQTGAHERGSPAVHLWADRTQKSRIIDGLVASTGYCRKYCHRTFLGKPPRVYSLSPLLDALVLKWETQMHLSKDKAQASCLICQSLHTFRLNLGANALKTGSAPQADEFAPSIAFFVRCDRARPPRSLDTRGYLRSSSPSRSLYPQ